MANIEDNIHYKYGKAITIAAIAIGHLEAIFEEEPYKKFKKDNIAFKLRVLLDELVISDIEKGIK